MRWLSFILIATCAVLSPAFPDGKQHIHGHHNKPPSPAGATRNEYEATFAWNIAAQAALTKKLHQRFIEKEAQNIILFLGDGWGLPTMTTGRILKGQEIDKVKFGEEAVLHSDTFPFSGTSKTYCVDAQVADSACASTAFHTGVKTNSGIIGVSSDVQYGDCAAALNHVNRLTSILKWAQDAGKSTGIITTTRITHATPAGAYAHTADRDMESDLDVTTRNGSNACVDIAKQLILQDPGRSATVVMGGGRAKFLPEGQGGERQDGINLVHQWKSQNRHVSAAYVETADELAKVDASKTDKLFGLFDANHMQYYFDQAKNNEPTLTDMTEKAIKILRKNPKGYFLLVEGGRIDLAHHNNQGIKALWEAIEFDRAIKMGDELTSEQDTLIVVTADHSHAYSFAGYAPRGSKLSDIAGMGDDGLPYSILNYANGPAWQPFFNNSRHDITNDDRTNYEYAEIPMVPLELETHGGEDVIILAKGPFSHLFSGVNEQNYIPHVMAYASCIGHGKKFCDKNTVHYTSDNVNEYVY